MQMSLKNNKNETESRAKETVKLLDLRLILLFYKKYIQKNELKFNSEDFDNILKTVRTKFNDIRCYSLTLNGPKVMFDPLIDSLEDKELVFLMFLLLVVIGIS